jgi:hypothetical protein
MSKLPVITMITFCTMLIIPAYAHASIDPSNLEECINAPGPDSVPERQSFEEEYRPYPKVNCMMDGAPLCIRIADGISEAENILNLFNMTHKGFIIDSAGENITKEDIAGGKYVLQNDWLQRFCTEPMSPS